MTTKKILCSPTEYFSYYDNVRQQTLKDGRFDIELISQPYPLCFYRLGENELTKYHCFDCYHIANIAEAKGSVIDKPFLVKNEKLSCFSQDIVVHKVDKSRMTTEPFYRWLIADILNKEDVVLANKLYAPFRCNDSYYFLEDSTTPLSTYLKRHNNKKTITALVSQLIICYLALAKHGWWLTKADIVVNHQPAAYFYSLNKGKKITVQSHFTIGFRNIEIAKAEESIYPLIYHVMTDKALRKVVYEHCYGWWRALWTANDLKVVEQDLILSKDALAKLNLKKDVLNILLDYFSN